MRFSSSDSRLKVLTLPAFLIVFAAAFFRLPYDFPVSPSVSASYVYQYNNRVAVLIFLVGAAVFAVFFRGLSLQPATRDSRVSRIRAFIAAAFCVALALFFWWLSIPDGINNDASYFQVRLAQLAAGRTIYRDFEFAYGPLWLYLPYWTGKLFHLSLINGYLLFWMIAWVVGIWILYRLVNAIDIPSPYRTAIFLVFVFDFAQATWPEGINYTPVRGLISSGLAILIYAAHKRRYPPAVITTAAVLCGALATCMSPEHGITFMLGTGLFFVFCVKQRRAGFWPSTVAMGLGFLAIVTIANRIGIYKTLHSFGTGALNYPIVPSAGGLIVMGLYLVAACVAYLAIKRHQTDSFFMYLLCICFFGLPSCFGRADPGHMQIAAISALIVTAFALSRYPKTLLAAAILFVYWDATPQFRDQAPYVREQAELRIFDPSERSELLYRPTVTLLHLLHRDAHREAIEAKVAQTRRDLQRIPALPPGAIVDSPFNLVRHGLYDTSGNVDYGYYLGPVVLPSQVDSQIQWLQSHPERKLILPRTWETQCHSFDEAEDSAFRIWHGIHWAEPKRPMDIYVPLCNFIHANFAPDEVPFSYDMRLWHPIAPSSTYLPGEASLTARRERQATLGQGEVWHKLARL